MKRLYFILVVFFFFSALSDARNNDTLVFRAIDSTLVGDIDAPVSPDSLLMNKIDSLQSVLDRLLPIRRRLSEDMLEIYGDYPYRRFRDMDSKVLDSLSADGNSLAMAELSGFLEGLNAASENRKVFVSIDSVINMPYDKDKVDIAKSLCASLMIKVKGDQRAEVESLYGSLTKYGGAWNTMRDVVEWIHDTMDLYRPDGNPSAAKTSLNGILNNRAAVIRNGINEIPYLKSLLDSLKKELENNPLVQGETETKLLKLLNL